MDKVMVKVLGSAHHVHLRRDHLDVLYGEGFELEIKRYLGEDGKGAYVSKQQVMVDGPKGQIRCSILGPERPYSQVEISYTDAQILGIVPKMTDSGELDGTAPCKITGPNGVLELEEGLMIARRHIHMNKEDLAKYGCKVGDMVRVHVGGPRALTFEQVVIKSGGGAMVMHVDFDEMNALGIKNSDNVMGEIIFANDKPYEA